jgi:four helix bundle protein
MTLKHYQELIAWQKAMDLVELVYKITGGFPREELFGLTAQMRKAAVSIPSNIAEGQGRNTTGDFLHFLGIALGSLQELETQVIVGNRLSYLNADIKKAFLNQTCEVGRLIHGLSNSLKDKQMTSG